jgi:hypothetical protein
MTLLTAEVAVAVAAMPAFFSMPLSILSHFEVADYLVVVGCNEYLKYENFLLA